MLRQLINVCVLVMFILQGMTQASAHLSDDTATQHCAGHEQADRDCSCCNDQILASSGGCAAVCAVMAPVQSASAQLPHLHPAHDSSFVARNLANPAYLPLNPPPIS